MNVAVTGAKPLAITNCLNFGSPENPEIYWQMREAVQGMAEACRALDTPVTGGNVSLYNETEGEAVYPTPVVGMLGLCEDVEKRITPGFKRSGDVVAVLGKVWGDTRSLAGSEYLELVHGMVAGDPREPDLNLAKGIIEVLTGGARQGLFSSAQDLSEGGLMVALAESCIHAAQGAAGCVVSPKALGCGGREDVRADAMLFGECNTAVVVSFPESNEDQVADICRRHGVPLSVIGRVGDSVVAVEACSGVRVLKVPTGEVKDAYFRGLETALKG